MTPRQAIVTCTSYLYGWLEAIKARYEVTLPITVTQLTPHQPNGLHPPSYLTYSFTSIPTLPHIYSIRSILCSVQQGEEADPTANCHVLQQRRLPHLNHSTCNAISPRDPLDTQSTLDRLVAASLPFSPVTVTHHHPAIPPARPARQPTSSIWRKLLFLTAETPKGSLNGTGARRLLFA